mmetsp:Transcript_4417/g.10284  ORF Transcript_4417/g.10284 Transcript_4417/m.10284 type:complete len:215 (+) Transcript_4417:1895-2539(+)
MAMCGFDASTARYLAMLPCRCGMTRRQVTTNFWRISQQWTLPLPTACGESAMRCPTKTCNGSPSPTLAESSFQEAMTSKFLRRIRQSMSGFAARQPCCTLLRKHCKHLAMDSSMSFLQAFSMERLLTFSSGSCLAMPRFRMCRSRSSSRFWCQMAWSPSTSRTPKNSRRRWLGCSRSFAEETPSSGRGCWSSGPGASVCPWVAWKPSSPSPGCR